VRILEHETGAADVAAGARNERPFGFFLIQVVPQPPKCLEVTGAMARSKWPRRS
jgi:hypothetical protein